MAMTKTSIAPDSAAALRGLAGDDATAEFESDPKSIDSNPTDRASSEHLALRDADDTEDSDEEDEEFDEEEEEEDEESEEDFDEEEEDDTEEFGATVMRVA